jgi:hypothetical protein
VNLPIVQLNLLTWQSIVNDNSTFEYLPQGCQAQSILSPQKQNSYEEEGLNDIDVEGSIIGGLIRRKRVCLIIQS